LSDGQLLLYGLLPGPGDVPYRSIDSLESFSTGPVSPPDTASPAGFFVLEASLSSRQRFEVPGRTSRPQRGGSLLDAVGGTPLLELARVAADVPGLTLLAKAEHTNPCGSVKDRPVRAMLLSGIASGRLTPGKTILEATSGNTGIADAMLGRALGFPVTLFLPSNASFERQAILRACGAELVLTDPLEGTDGAIRAARLAVRQSPSKYFYPDQYSNPANWRAHFETTGPEIWADTDGRLTHFVAGLGTSGTFVGVARFLKGMDASIRCVSVEPDGPLHGLEGLKHMASAMVPAIYDPALADEKLSLPTEEAWAMCRRLAREEGVFVGPSSGANVAAALRLARSAGASPKNPAVIVTVLCDRGERYLSDNFWREP
jgi:S-sulfo-L-cysteine synthase (O-acetyl-L-serine-dependent)